VPRVSPRICGCGKDAMFELSLLHRTINSYRALRRPFVCAIEKYPRVGERTGKSAV
jgi:hypothetical protein